MTKELEDRLDLIPGKKGWMSGLRERYIAVANDMLGEEFPDDYIVDFLKAVFWGQPMVTNNNDKGEFENDG